MYQPISIVNIYYQGFGAKRLIGKLTMDGRRPAFGYDAAWLADGMELSPIEMPLRAAPYYGTHASSHYLCGLLSDSLPDGWGMLLMDRFFRKKMSHATPINVLDRLAYIGNSAMGALNFEPQQDLSGADIDITDFTLAKLAAANQTILSGQDSDILAELIVIGGSPQGARPKALILYDEATEFITTDLTSEHPSATPWLIKFPAQSEHKSVCLLEALYADMAKKAGLNMPAHHYCDIDEKYAAFGVERFDRMGNQRVHIHTLAGLLDIDFRIPSLDYLQYLRCVRMLTQSQAAVEEGFRHAAFNVIFNNKDDHSKNFSFMMDETGRWSLSPVYDIAYNSGMNGYHQMDVAGEARHPTALHLLKLAKLADIKQNKATAIIEQVTAVAKGFLKIINNYDIEKELSNQVMHDVKANIDRMVNGQV
ncbi:type II toxin-antitoxin system HipA family toxin [Psychrobacter sp. P2G3]|uniref:type II toxin-antitoxin system HipA family toxin n=1 Tax=Psychrobacter sp. P2G3 TaxID=1699622 RepID=UPI00082D9E94|nr:type II toxin-antitoxin system HipA family toxin [Psychrobacter sp. P2G3]